MVMLAATLSTELQKMENITDEAVVRNGWADAYRAYMMESSILGISPATPGTLQGARDAMAAALTGISLSPDALTGAQMIVASLGAFWTVALAAATAIWVTVPPLVPTPFILPAQLLAPPVVAQALAAIFAANTAGQLSEKDSYDAIVGVLHPASAGATVTQAVVPTPLVVPIL
jgi:hypothetical protein